MAAEVQDSVFNWPVIIGATISAAAAIGSVVYNTWRTGQYRKEDIEARERHRLEDAEARERDRQDGASLRAEKHAQERILISVSLIEIMEAFAAGCADVAQDCGEPCGAYGEYESVTVRPDLSFDGITADWHSLPGPLLFRIQDMGPRLSTAKTFFGRSMHDAYDDPPYFREYYETLQLLYADLGIRSLGISRRLRALNGLPSTRLGNGRWSVEERLIGSWRKNRESLHKRNRRVEED